MGTENDRKLWGESILKHYLETLWGEKLIIQKKKNDRSVSSTNCKLGTRQIVNWEGRRRVVEWHRKWIGALEGVSCL